MSHKIGYSSGMPKLRAHFATSTVRFSAMPYKSPSLCIWALFKYFVINTLMSKKWMDYGCRVSRWANKLICHTHSFLQPPRLIIYMPYADQCTAVRSVFVPPEMDDCIEKCLCKYWIRCVKFPYPDYDYAGGLMDKTGRPLNAFKGCWKF